MSSVSHVDVRLRLRTVFLDGGVEKEGNNLDFNVQQLMSFYQSSEERLASQDSLNDDDDVALSNMYVVLRRICREEDDALSELKVSSCSQQLEIDGSRNQPTVRSASPSQHDTNKSSCGAPSCSGSWARQLLGDTTELAALAQPMLRKQKNLNHHDRPLRCPHCKLLPQDPPFFVVPAVDGGRRHPAAPILRYGNLPLGITHPNTADDQLWLAVAKLQVPTYADLTVEQSAHACRDHFLSSVGVPPWIETLLVSQRTHAEHVARLQNEIQGYAERNVELKNEISRLKRSVHAGRMLATLNDNEEHRNALLSQLEVAQLEVADKQWQVVQGERKNARDTAMTRIHTALIAFRTEEVQRMLFSISKWYDLFQSLRRMAAPEAARKDSSGLENLYSACDNIPKKVLEALHSMPSSEYGKSTRRMINAGGLSSSGVVERDPALDAALACMQCKHCLLLVSYSPFCPVTGVAHLQQALDDEALSASQSHADDAVAHPEPDALDAGLADFASDTSHDHIRRSTTSFGAESARHSMVIGSQRASVGGEALSTGGLGSDVYGGRSQDSGSLATPESVVTPPPGNHVGPLEVDTPPAKSGKKNKRGIKNMIPAMRLAHALGHDGADQTASPVGSDAALQTPDASNPISPKVSRAAQEVSAVTDVFNLCANQVASFLEAASAGDFRAVRDAMRPLEPVNGAPALNSSTALQGEVAAKCPGTAAALLELETKFAEWLYAMSLDVPTNAAQPPAAAAGSQQRQRRDGDSARVLKLQKELRDLEYAFARRPNARNQGVNLDEDALIALALRLKELEKKTAPPPRTVQVVNPSTTTGKPKVESASSSQVPHTPPARGTSKTAESEEKVHPHSETRQSPGPRELRMEVGISALSLGNPLKPVPPKTGAPRSVLF